MRSCFSYSEVREAQRRRGQLEEVHAWMMFRGTALTTGTISTIFAWHCKVFWEGNLCVSTNLHD